MSEKVDFFTQRIFGVLSDKSYHKYTYTLYYSRVKKSTITVMKLYFIPKR